jgi:hypothetical protein
MKLIENWWGRAWTHLSVFDGGQIGRFRGEMERENALLVACREGRDDPRKWFPSLQDLLREFEACVSFIDHDPIESKQYGTWVPMERWDADIAAHPRAGLSTELAPFAAPESHVVTVRNAGMVVCNVTDPLGIPTLYTFASDEMVPFEGQKVRVLFDPFEPVIKAAIILNETNGLAKAGDLLAMATCMNPPPLPIASEGWAIVRDPAGLSDALAEKKAIAKAVRTEYRAAAAIGGRATRLSEIRTPDGVERIEISGGAPADQSNPGEPPRSPDIPRQAAPVDFARRAVAAGPEMPEPIRRRLKTFAELAEA